MWRVGIEVLSTEVLSAEEYRYVQPRSAAFLLRQCGLQAK